MKPCSMCPCDTCAYLCDTEQECEDCDEYIEYCAAEESADTDKR